MPITRDLIFVAAARCKTDGHDWVSKGGRPCPMVDQGAACPARNLICGRPGFPSQPVFECRRCPAIDCGSDRRGPGYAACSSDCMPFADMADHRL